MASLGYQVDASVPAPANPSCFGSIEEAADRVRDLARRIEHTVERLAGSYPEPGQTAGEIKGSPNGLFSSAEEHAGHIRDAVGRASAALDRLDKRLP